MTGPDAAAVNMAETTTTTTPPTEASATASEITTELVVPAAAAANAEEDSFTELLQHGGDDAVALDIGFSDYLSGGGGGKALALGDTYSFEWPPPALDLGAFWGSTDADTAVFMNIP